jgi:hypothetical protein
LRWGRPLAQPRAAGVKDRSAIQDTLDGCRLFLAPARARPARCLRSGLTSSGRSSAAFIDAPSSKTGIVNKLAISCVATSLLATPLRVVLAENALPVAPPTTLPPAVSAVATTAMQPGPSMPPAPPAPTAAPSTRVGLMSRKLMREKGVISQAEYDDAIKDLGETTGAQTPSQESVVFGRWATTVYGFLAADMILDSTRSLTEATGGTLIAQGRTPAGDNARMTMSVRYTRFGLRMKAPQFGQVMTSATLEGDFLGNQPAVQTGPYPAASWFDVNLFTDPAPGIRFGLE